MVEKIVKKICEKCKKINPHCHFEARVYWLDDGQTEKVFTLYWPINKRYRKGETKQMADAARTLTYGERMVGLNFNPGNNPGVQKVKEQYAAIIDDLNALRGGCTPTSFKYEMCTKGINEAMTAQMWAVKAITWTDEIQ